MRDRVRSELLFRRKKVRREEDRVWTTEESKLQGITEEIRKKVEEGFKVLVIAHFSDTLEKFTKAAEKNGIECDRVRDKWEMAKLDLRNSQKGKVTAFLSELVVRRKYASERSESRPAKRSAIHIAVIEHYPTPERDKVLLSFSEELPPGTTVRFHASLDEPLLKAFGADRTFALLSKLGWQKTGWMTSSAITSAIASGQEKIKKISTSDEKVNSQKEWFYYNCPQLRDRMK